MKLLFGFLLFICSVANADNVADKNLIARNNLSHISPILLKSEYLKISQLYTFDKNLKEIESKGVVLTVKPKAAYSALSSIRKALEATPAQAYLMDNNFGYNPDEIAVVNTKDDLEYLKIIKTDGLNYDITSEEVLKRYVLWKTKYDLKLLGAGHDWLEAEILATDVNWKELAHEVYEFCPDIVEQGSGDVKSLQAEMKRAKRLFLWWD